MNKSELDINSHKSIISAVELAFKWFTIDDYMCMPEQAEITKRYRRLSLTYHPDKGGTAEEFTQLQVLYEILSNKLILKKYCEIKSGCRKTKYEQNLEDFFKSPDGLQSETINSVIDSIFAKYRINSSRNDAKDNTIANNITELFKTMTKQMANGIRGVKSDSFELAERDIIIERDISLTSYRLKDVRIQRDGKTAKIKVESLDYVVDIKFMYKKFYFSHQHTINNEMGSLDYNIRDYSDLISINLRDCVNESDNYLMFHSKGNEYLDNDGLIKRGDLLLDLLIVD